MMRLPRMAAALAGAAAILTGCSNMKQIKHMPYPRTERTDVTDNYFGTEVPDPYRWLEDDNSEATAAWVKAQNVVTQDYLSQIPFRGAIRERLTELWNYPKEGIPAKHGDAWYYFYNDGLRNQSVLYRTAQPGGEGEVFIDPNTLSEDGTVALSGVTFSKDGKYCAYSVAASGSDWVEIRVMNTADRTLTSDRINWVKFSGAEWAPDSKGFYYSAYDATSEGRFLVAEPVSEGLLPPPRHAPVGRLADLCRRGASAALFQPVAQQGRAVALHRGFGGYVGYGSAL